MAQSTNNVVRLSFSTQAGKAFSISVPEPLDDIQPSAATTVMNSIIAGGIFETPNGTLTGVRDIKVINTTTNDLYDPPQT